MSSLLSEVLQYLFNNNYRRASFDRLIGIVPSASTYEQLENFVNDNDVIFRHAAIKGGLPGLAVRDDINVAAALQDSRRGIEEVEATPMTSVSVDPSLEAEIADTYYRNLGSAIKAPDGPAGNVTLCILILRNGFVIIGKSICLYASDYNENIGQQLAREDALKKLKPFMAWRDADKRIF